MLRNSRLSCGIACVLIAVASAGAQTPGLEGTWKLDVTRSDFGPERPPQSLTVRLTIREPKIHMAVHGVSSDGQEQKFERQLTTDGKPVTNEDQTTDSAQWDGKILVIEHNTQNYTLIRRISLSDDGKTATSKDTFMLNAGGQMVMTEVFNRQP